MIDRRVKLRHFLCFQAVAQQRSLQNAAKALSITQPAVSNTIKELEDILGVRLFERNRRGTVLTPAADAFSPYAEACINAMQSAVNIFSRPENPVIHIGAARALTASFVPQVLMAFRQRVPGIQVRVSTSTTYALMSQLREHVFDLVLCRYSDPEQTVGLSFEYLYTDPLAVVVRNGHPLCHAPAGADERCPYPVVLPMKTSINRHAADSLVLTLGLGRPVDVIESHEIQLGRTYALQGEAIWFVPWSAVQDDVANGTLVKLWPLQKDPQDDGANGKQAGNLMARLVGLMTHSNSALPPQTQVLIGVIRECALAHRAGIELPLGGSRT